MVCKCVHAHIHVSELIDCDQQFTGILRELPDSIHLLTLQSLGNGSYLLRLEHQFEYEMNGAEWVKPVILSLPVSSVYEVQYQGE